MKRNISLHDIEEDRLVGEEEASTVFGGADNYGMAGNTGTKTGGNATNYGNTISGNGGASGNANGYTSGYNYAGPGGNAFQWTDFGRISGHATGGAGGNITNTGASSGNGGAGGNATGASGGSVTDNIVTEVSIPVTMSI